MTTEMAAAYPRKRFFLEMFTRDISLEDCILDLIDNSIDGLIRTRSLDISASLLNEAPASTVSRAQLARIDMKYSKDGFRITDTCGGIPRDHALKDVFNFGHGPDAMAGKLGAYGVGLKRAIFKMGDRFKMKSRTAVDGFDVDLNVREWSEKDGELGDWRIPITFAESAPSPGRAGTAIEVTKLRSEVISRMDDGTFDVRLRTTISQTYGLFIGRYVIITVNAVEVEAFQIPLGASDKVEPGHDRFEAHGVKVELFASLAERMNEQWKAERAGWYVLCNGRIVVAADKGELTGWGSDGCPQFHDGKHRGFVGVAFFIADDPTLLPWTTTKRGLHRESPIYQAARNKMRGIARPILKFLDSMYYKSDVPEEPAERQIADEVRSVSLSSLAAKPSGVFSVKAGAKLKPKTTVRVVYDVEKADVERIKKHLKEFAWRPSKVGRYTFDVYLENECPE